LSGIGPGDEGRTRYTFTSQSPADNQVGIDIGSPHNIPGQLSNNLGTDTKIEVARFGATLYPVVAVDTVNRTITLTFDFAEAGIAFPWIAEIATGHGSPTSMSIIQEDVNGVETSRTNYFSVFPIVFQHFTGFGQPEKVKFRLVVAYGLAEPG
jgi:hypothetical protein